MDFNIQTNFCVCDDMSDSGFKYLNTLLDQIDNLFYAMST